MGRAAASQVERAPRARATSSVRRNEGGGDVGAWQTQAGGQEALGRLTGDGAADPVIRFRRFTVLPQERLVLREGRPVDLGSRAFDLLMVLLRSRGEVVSKTQIVDHVWPSTIVDDSNLRFQMACLRRALGADRDVIKTIQGRGYLFAAEITGDGGDRQRHGPPLARPSPSRMMAAVALTDSGARPSETPIVAVIDDDRDVRESIRGLLRSAGVRVEVFESVDAFLDSGRSSQADCLVLDVWLPGRSGLEFQGDIVKACIDIPIIFISGHADIHMSVRAMKAGAVEFLTKPVRHEDLLGAIQTAALSPRHEGQALRWRQADYRPSDQRYLTGPSQDVGPEG